MIDVEREYYLHKSGCKRQKYQHLLFILFVAIMQKERLDINT